MSDTEFNKGAIRMYSTNSCPYPRQGVTVQETCGDIVCKTRAPFPCNPVLAMAYVPFQQMEEIYTCEKALSVGTVFPCLDLPFTGCCR